MVPSENKTGQCSAEQDSGAWCASTRLKRGCNWIRLAGHQALSVSIQPLDNVNLYSLMAEALKIKPANTDCSILKPSGEFVLYRGRCFESED